jgi:ribosomal protein S18 acetylase RimI-like enzyme
MKIRKMTRADLPALARMNAEIFKGTDRRQALVALRHSFEGRVDGACLVAKEDGKPTGAVFGEKKTTFYKNAAYISSFFVSKGARGKGTGKALFAACLAAMKKKGIQSLSITVETRNRRAFSFYKKSGFKPFRSLLLLRRF